MVQMLVITKRSGTDRLIRDFPDKVDTIKRRILEQMAGEIAVNSPVDSGEYVTNHRVALRSGSFTANRSRPDGIPRISKGDTVDVQAKAQEGLENMLAQIASINIKSENFVFRNPMLYARLVEGKYAVYAQARKNAAQFVREAVQEVRRGGS